MASMIVIWCVIAGCASRVQTPTLPPAPDRLGVSASLEAFAQAKVTAYARSVSVPSFDLEVWPEAQGLEATGDGTLQMLVSFAPPPDKWFATPLGYESIAVIVDPALPVRNLTLAQLGDLFSGRFESWDALDGPEKPIQLVIPPQGDGLRERFEETVLNGRHFPLTALVAPTPAAMSALVDQTSGAIGFLPASALPEGARVVSLDGKTPPPSGPSTPGYALRFEVIATAPQEPQGGVRDWLAWLQEQP
jgi:hypothetical protein